jgi:hypothetical protein
MSARREVGKLGARLIGCTTDGERDCVRDLVSIPPSDRLTKLG